MRASSTLFETCFSQPHGSNCWVQRVLKGTSFSRSDEPARAADVLSDVTDGTEELTTDRGELHVGTWRWYCAAVRGTQFSR